MPRGKKNDVKHAGISSSSFWFDSAAVSQLFLLHELPYAWRADSASNRERQKIYQAFNENGGIHRGWNF